jgi:hypothetical protein
MTRVESEDAATARSFPAAGSGPGQNAGVGGFRSPRQTEPKFDLSTVAGVDCAQRDVLDLIDVGEVSQFPLTQFRLRSQEPPTTRFSAQPGEELDEALAITGHQRPDAESTDRRCYETRRLMTCHTYRDAGLTLILPNMNAAS